MADNLPTNFWTDLSPAGIYARVRYLAENQARQSTNSPYGPQAMDPNFWIRKDKMGQGWSLDGSQNAIQGMPPPPQQAPSGYDASRATLGFMGNPSMVNPDPYTDASGRLQQQYTQVQQQNPWLASNKPPPPPPQAPQNRMTGTQYQSKPDYSTGVQTGTGGYDTSMPARPPRQTFANPAGNMNASALMNVSNGLQQGQQGGLPPFPQQLGEDQWRAINSRNDRYQDSLKDFSGQIGSAVDTPSEWTDFFGRFSQEHPEYTKPFSWEHGTQFTGPGGAQFKPDQSAFGGGIPWASDVSQQGGQPGGQMFNPGGGTIGGGSQPNMNGNQGMLLGGSTGGSARQGATGGMNGAGGNTASPPGASSPSDDPFGQKAFVKQWEQRNPGRKWGVGNDYIWAVPE